MTRPRQGTAHGTRELSTGNGASAPADEDGGETSPEPDAEDGWMAEGLCEGQRVGRFVVLRDIEGRLHAIAAVAVGAVCETDDGSLLMLPGGRLLQSTKSLDVILRWLAVA